MPSAIAAPYNLCSVSSEMKAKLDNNTALIICKKTIISRTNPNAIPLIIFYLLDDCLDRRDHARNEDDRSEVDYRKHRFSAHCFCSLMLKRSSAPRGPRFKADDFTIALVVD